MSGDFGEGSASWWFDLPGVVVLGGRLSVLPILVWICFVSPGEKVSLFSLGKKETTKKAQNQKQQQMKKNMALGLSPPCTLKHFWGASCPGWSCRSLVWGAAGYTSGCTGLRPTALVRSWSWSLVNTLARANFCQLQMSCSLRRRWKWLLGGLRTPQEASMRNRRWESWCCKLQIAPTALRAFTGSWALEALREELQG